MRCQHYLIIYVSCKCTGNVSSYEVIDINKGGEGKKEFISKTMRNLKQHSKETNPSKKEIREQRIKESEILQHKRRRRVKSFSLTNFRLFI
jgi:hypothetical protein